ncbi:MAG: hypothetical protein LBG49_01635 [Mycoplasmataceae bacterium]|nr:hypothetical protein [Mycoplasmataceae bacterium]
MVIKKYRNNNRSVNTNKNNKTFINMNRENNECYTRKIESDKLIKYLKTHKIISTKAKIWLPFNDFKSNIYLSLKEVGFNNLIATSGDFYNTKVKFDIIISNPPFSKRSKLFLRLMEINKPFILLQPIMFFNNGTCIKILTKNGAKFGALCPQGRMTFERNFGFLCPKNNMGFIVNGVEKEKTTSFYSFWLCFKTKITGFTDLE